jgi:hypothetical protein
MVVCLSGEMQVNPAGTFFTGNNPGIFYNTV